MQYLESSRFAVSIQKKIQYGCHNYCFRSRVNVRQVQLYESQSNDIVQEEHHIIYIIDDGNDEYKASYDI